MDVDVDEDVDVDRYGYHVHGVDGEVVVAARLVVERRARRQQDGAGAGVDEEGAVGVAVDDVVEQRRHGARLDLRHEGPAGRVLEHVRRVFLLAESVHRNIQKKNNNIKMSSKTIVFHKSTIRFLY